ncbi:MAG: response regulator transcription factor [Acidobacteriia bacterium]|nr:response regulator transcription factor [Terriglobia bacterium]
MRPSSGATRDAPLVLVADSNRMQAQLLTSALRRRSEFSVATCQMDAQSLLRAVSSSMPKVVLLSLNVSLSLAESMATLRQFHFSHPDITKVLLVESIDRELVVSAFRSGVRGVFCLAEANLHLLRKCIERVASGQIWANTEQLNYLLDLISEVPSLRVVNSSGDQLLTPREEQVVALVAEGLANREVARELNLSEHTIKKYLFRIFDKLGISTRVELVLFAVNHGDPRHAEWLAGLRQTPPDA